jgi:hypothetical protein
MSYQVFQAKVRAVIASYDDQITVRFRHDTDKGRFFAYCSDGTTIITSESCLRATIRWGSGHQAMATL